MGKDVAVDDHAYKHGLTEQEIRYAWDHFVRMLHRGSPREGQILPSGATCKVDWCRWPPLNGSTAF